MSSIVAARVLCVSVLFSLGCSASAAIVKTTATGTVSVGYSTGVLVDYLGSAPLVGQRFTITTYQAVDHLRSYDYDSKPTDVQNFDNPMLSTIEVTVGDTARSITYTAQGLIQLGERANPDGQWIISSVGDWQLGANFGRPSGVGASIFGRGSDLWQQADLHQDITLSAPQFSWSSARFSWLYLADPSQYKPGVATDGAVSIYGIADSMSVTLTGQIKEEYRSNAVPEPPALALVCLGAGLMAGLRRPRR